MGHTHTSVSIGCALNNSVFVTGMKGIQGWPVCVDC